MLECNPVCAVAYVDIIRTVISSISNVTELLSIPLNILIPLLLSCHLFHSNLSVESNHVKSLTISIVSWQYNKSLMILLLNRPWDISS